MSIPSKAFTPKRIRRSIKMDRVHPADLRRMKFIYNCEQCSHYSVDNDICSIGYNAELHKKSAQQKRYESHGHMALCRFIEID